MKKVKISIKGMKIILAVITTKMPQFFSTLEFPCFAPKRLDDVFLLQHFMKRFAILDGGEEAG